MFSILNNIFDKFIFRYEQEENERFDEKLENHKKKLNEKLEKHKKKMDEKVEKYKKIMEEEVENNKKRLDEDLENYKKQSKERIEFFNEQIRKSNERIEKYKREKQEKLLYNNAVRIQCFIRISLSKKNSDILRSIPDNLFDPEFSLIRKKMLNIDDSCFN